MWYILQLTIVLVVVYYYKNEIAPTAHLGHITLFAFCLAYGVTWFLSKVLDFLLLIRTWAAKHR